MYDCGTETETTLFLALPFSKFLLPYQISSENNKLCNANDYSYELVNYLFLKLAFM